MEKGGNKMKKVFLGVILLWLVIVIPIPANGWVHIGVEFLCRPLYLTELVCSCHAGCR